MTYKINKRIVGHYHSGRPASQLQDEAVVARGRQGMGGGADGAAAGNGNNAALLAKL